MSSPPPDPQLEPTFKIGEFFLARQPILSREQSVSAYELLFRHAKSDVAVVTDDRAATASVISHMAELGLDNVLGSRRGFVNVDAATLSSDFIRFLPHEKVVLEILEKVEATPKMVKRVAALAEQGFSFALDDVVTDSANLRKFLPHVAVVKIDIQGMAQDTLHSLAQTFKAEGKTLLAEKVETLEEFAYCHELGFDLFQGYYFARPALLSGKKLTPSQITIMHLIVLLACDANNAEVEQAIKEDAAVYLLLLRLVNTPGQGVTKRIDSLSMALMVLGRRQLQRWLQIMLYADSGKSAGHVAPLLLMATARARLLELASLHCHPRDKDRASAAFTVGILSLMDALFCQPMAQILDRVPVGEEIRQALLQRQGPYGPLLALVESSERDNAAEEECRALLHQFGISLTEWNALQWQAFEWSEEVVALAY